VRPRILVHLLQAQRDPAPVLVDRQHAAGDLCPFRAFVGMADLARPGHVGDVQQAVDAFFQFDEGAVVGQVADLAGDTRLPDTARHVVPRVLLGLLHAQRQLLAFGDRRPGSRRRSRRRY
jgi:hypothetical protein